LSDCSNATSTKLKYEYSGVYANLRECKIAKVDAKRMHEWHDSLTVMEAVGKKLALPDIYAKVDWKVC
jgi:hypothetical protein